MSKTGKRRYVVPSTSPPTTSSDSSTWEEDGKEDAKKKRKCTRKHKPDYNESSTKAHMRESYVFSTALANLAASAVKHRMCDTIITYHQGLPREPNKLTIKPPKITSTKFLSSSLHKSPKSQNDKNSINTCHDNNDEGESTSVKKNCNKDNKKEKETKKKKIDYCYNGTSPSTVKSPNSRTPLTPPRSPPPCTPPPRKASPDVPLTVGDYALTLSERIKCRSRTCAPKVNYSDDKDEVHEETIEQNSSKDRKSVLSRSRTKDVRSKTERRRSRSMSKSFDADDNEPKSPTRLTRLRSKPQDVKRSKSSSSEAGPVLKSDPETKPSLKSPTPVAKPVTPPVPPPVLPPVPLVSPELAAILSQTETPPKEPKELPLTRPSLFEAALKSPSRIKPKNDKAKNSISPRNKKEGGFKPVKDKVSSNGAESSETSDQLSSKFKPLPIGGITPSPQKKNRSFKFRTTQGSKHDMKFVDSIFTSPTDEKNLSGSQESSPATTPKDPDTPTTPTSQQPIQKTSHPKPELVIGSPNLGSSKPPPLVVPYSPRLTVVTPHPPHMTAHMSHPRSGPISLAGPPPLSSPKFSLAHVSPNKNKARSPEDIIRIPVKVSVGQKSAANSNKSVTVKAGQRTITLPSSKRGTDSEPPPPEKKKKRFVFPTEDTTPLLKGSQDAPNSPINVTSPISPPSGSPISLRGPGSTRVSPISPQTAVETVQSTPAPTPLRNGIPVHKSSPKNSPQSRRTPLDFLADFSGRRSPLAININKDTPKTSPLTPKVSPSTAGQFYQPNIALSHSSCSIPVCRGELKLSESVIEHSKLSAHQLNNTLPRQPVVTINHQQVTFDQERIKEASLKQRIAVENNQRMSAQQAAADDRLSKQHHQEIFARQQLLSRAFSPYHLSGTIPTTAHSKIGRQFDLTQQLKQQDIGSLVDLYGRTGDISKMEKDQINHMQRPLQHPAFPTHLKPTPRQASPQQHQSPRQPSPRAPTQQSPRAQQRTVPPEHAHQERERLLAQQHERLLAQQRQHATDPHNHYSPQHHYQTAQLQHLPYGGVLNPMSYGAVLNPQLYKQLAESTSAQVTSASLLQSLAGYQQLQLAAAAGKLGPLAHLYRDNSKPPGNGTKTTLKTPSQFGVIRP